MRVPWSISLGLAHRAGVTGMIGTLCIFDRAHVPFLFSSLAKGKRHLPIRVRCDLVKLAAAGGGSEKGRRKRVQSRQPEDGRRPFHVEHRRPRPLGGTRHLQGRSGSRRRRGRRRRQGWVPAHRLRAAVQEREGDWCCSEEDLRRWRGQARRHLHHLQDMIHWPFQVKKGTEISPENFVQPDIPKTWRAMEQLYDSGKARAIGVSNFSSKKLGDLLAVARVPPAVDQVECHLGWQQAKLRAFCRSNGVHLSAYAPLGRMKDVASNPVVSSIAESLGKTPAQIALRWGLQQGQSVLPKSANESRLKENIDLFDWSIPEELCAKLSEITQAKQIKGDAFVHPQSVYKTYEELFDGEI